MSVLYTARQGWAIFAAILSALAVGFEVVTRICAALFDPLPDVWCIAAYIFIIVMLLINEYVLYHADEFPLPEGAEGKLKLATVGTHVAIGIAVVYSVLFAPLLPISWIALMYYGCGAGAWSPLINLIVLLCQMRALREQRRLHNLGPVLNRQSLAMIAYVLLGVCVVLAIMPSERRSIVARHAPGYVMFSSWWGYINGKAYHNGIPWDTED